MLNATTNTALATLAQVVYTKPSQAYKNTTAFILVHNKWGSALNPGAISLLLHL